jgi:hypothetical protein
VIVLLPPVEKPKVNLAKTPGSPTGGGLPRVYPLRGGSSTLGANLLPTDDHLKTRSRPSASSQNGRPTSKTLGLLCSFASMLSLPCRNRPRS